MMSSQDIHISASTILIVEIKPEHQHRSIAWERLWYYQVREQARHAFVANDKLKYHGIRAPLGLYCYPTPPS